MQTQQSTEADISVSLSPDGHAVIYQGFYKQSMVLERENISRFIATPTLTPLLLIPPFASAALECHMAMGQVESTKIVRDPAIGPEWHVIFTLNTGAKIAYYSYCDAIQHPRRLARQGVSIAITPMAAVGVDASGKKPQVIVIASVPTAELTDYTHRFACDPRMLSAALRKKLNKSLPRLRYEN